MGWNVAIWMAICDIVMSSMWPFNIPLMVTVILMRLEIFRELQINHSGFVHETHDIIIVDHFIELEQGHGWKRKNPECFTTSAGRVIVQSSAHLWTVSLETSSKSRYISCFSRGSIAWLTEASLAWLSARDNKHPECWNHSTKSLRSRKVGTNAGSKSFMTHFRGDRKSFLAGKMVQSPQFRPPWSQSS